VKGQSREVGVREVEVMFRGMRVKQLSEVVRLMDRSIKERRNCWTNKLYRMQSKALVKPIEMEPFASSVQAIEKRAAILC
jgi:hypothetical protein